jgi:hypothetical protein
LEEEVIEVFGGDFHGGGGIKAKGSLDRRKPFG